MNILVNILSVKIALIHSMTCQKEQGSCYAFV